MPQNDRTDALLLRVSSLAQRRDRRPGIGVLARESDGLRAALAALKAECGSCGIYHEAYTFSPLLGDAESALRPLLEEREDLELVVSLPMEGSELLSLLPPGTLEEWGLSPEELRTLTPEEPLFRALLLLAAVLQP